jgi:flagellar basal-body rod modification protein FlgD
MAITSTGLNAATNKELQATTVAKDKSALGKDDFMKLLLVQLQYQDPTEPMDSEKILTQTSQLAALEASDNTKTALEELTARLGSTDQFATISAIGKMADLGSDGITYEQGSDSTFEVYFPSENMNGKVEIVDTDGNVVGKVYNILDDNGEVTGKLNDGDARVSDVYKFTWDGIDINGKQAKDGIYHVQASYTNPTTNKTEYTKLGTYPIQSIRFEDGNALAKVGSSYVPLEQILEVY